MWYLTGDHTHTHTLPHPAETVSWLAAGGAALWVSLSWPPVLWRHTALVHSGDMLSSEAFFLVCTYRVLL